MWHAECNHISLNRFPRRNFFCASADAAAVSAVPEIVPEIVPTFAPIRPPFAERIGACSILKISCFSSSCFCNAVRLAFFQAVFRSPARNRQATGTFPQCRNNRQKQRQNRHPRQLRIRRATRATSLADTLRAWPLGKVPCPEFRQDMPTTKQIGRISNFARKDGAAFGPDGRDNKRNFDMERKPHGAPRGADKRTSRGGEAKLAGGGGHAGHDHDHSGGVSRQMTPLQAEFLEDGELPEDDLLAIVLGRADVATKAGYAPGGPKPLSGPREELSYDCGIAVLQWDIDPHDAAQTTRQHEIRVGEWDYRVWWQVHPRASLLYVSMQAMREDWVTHEGASPHPVGRSEAVNLVFDQGRDAVVAIYGTVRDFRPFVKAFSLAYEREATAGNTTENPQGGKP